MEVVYERCCGRDIHKQVIVACLIVPGTAGKPTKEIRRFGTLTPDLLALADWLGAAGCRHAHVAGLEKVLRPLIGDRGRKLGVRRTGGAARSLHSGPEVL